MKVNRFELIRREGDWIVIENTPAPAALWEDGTNREEADAYIHHPNYKGGYIGFYTNMRPATKEMGEVIVRALNEYYGKVTIIPKHQLPTIRRVKN